MITATGTMTFTTSTTPAELLRSLVDLVEDLHFAGINVKVTVAIGDGDSPTAEPAPFIMPVIPTTPPAPVWTSSTMTTTTPPAAGRLGFDVPTNPHIFAATYWADAHFWHDLWPTVEQLNSTRTTFRRLSNAQRYTLAGVVCRAIAEILNKAPITQRNFDDYKPFWMPGASGLLATLGMRWKDAVTSWLRQDPYPGPADTTEADDGSATFRR